MIREVARQFRFTNKAFWRNPASAFFTFVFPLMFLVIFTSLLGNGTSALYPGGPHDQDVDVLRVLDGGVRVDLRLLHEHRDLGRVRARRGILKRLRGTPLPARSYLTARVLHATFVGFLLVAITVVFGRSPTRHTSRGRPTRCSSSSRCSWVPGASPRSGSR